LLIVFIPSYGHAWPSVYPTGVTINDRTKTYGGYNLFVPYGVLRKEPIKLIDMEGNLVHSWDPSPHIANVVKPLSGGKLLYITDSVNGNSVIEVDWDGQITWSIQASKYGLFHHDVQRLSNGNTLLLSRHKTVHDKINPVPLYYDRLAEVNHQNELEWFWYSADYFDDFGFSESTKEYIYNYRWKDVPKWTLGYTDLYHTNSIQALPPNRNEGDSRFKQGNILMSQRHTNIIFIIDKDSGQIVWQIGPDDNMTIGQHDAHMIEEGLPGAGNILVFDNGNAGGYPMKCRFYSRVLEIDPVTKHIVWSYNGANSETGSFLWSFNSPRISGAQRLPNGNTLINEGSYSRFFEVTSDGEIVWEYVEANPPLMIYRVYRVDQDWIPESNR
jgi:hypothetical protein